MTLPPTPRRYSEEIFSQHSRRHSNDTGSEISDEEHLPDDHLQSHHLSPKRKKKGEILASPIHRKITPTGITSKDVENDEEQNIVEEQVHAKFSFSIFGNLLL